MTKDYFQDIVPPHKKSSAHAVPVRTKRPLSAEREAPIPVHAKHESDEIEEIDVEDIPLEESVPARGIRSIAPNPNRSTRSRDAQFNPHASRRLTSGSTNWWII